MKKNPEKDAQRVIDYLRIGGDVTKYDTVQSKRILGEHGSGCKFSIIIPTYGRITLLKEAIKSALSQFYDESYEIVVVDNNSDDEAFFASVYKLISSFNDDRIVYYRNQKNIGIYGNTLRAGQLAAGEWIVLLDDDDILHPWYLRVIDGIITKINFSGVIGTIPAEFRDQKLLSWKFPNSVFFYKISKIEFFFGTTVTSPGLCLPKKLYENLYNSYDGLLMGDQILQYKALKTNGLVFVNYPFARYRVGNNATKQDSVVKSNTIHMCHFRHQTAKDSIFLRIYCKFLEKQFFCWYVDDVVRFWKKRMFKEEVKNELGIGNINDTQISYWFNVLIIKVVRKIFGKFRNRFSFSVERGIDY